MNERPFGLMFHYFHGGGHPAGQGTLSGLQFENILDRYLAGQKLLQAKEWARRAENASLQSGEVCITFDDALRSQFDIALPVLRKKGLTAFWFVQSGVLTGEQGLLEAFRHFRNAYFSSISDFHQSFYEMASSVCPDETVLRMAAPVPDGYLAEFSFYTQEDRRFRHVRDNVLGPQEYVRVMEDLIRSQGTSVEALSAGLMLDRECLQTLAREGHLVGLHSHSHPTCLADLPLEQQSSEYLTNLQVLSGILAAPPFTVAHPCNSYSAGTLEILRGLGIRIGFRSNMAMQDGSALEYPRKDSADLLRESGA
jgi:peptidoglycan/xylan/chitin deacetylase (PgdA/CDA1 family)